MTLMLDEDGKNIPLIGVEQRDLFDLTLTVWSYKKENGGPVLYINIPTRLERNDVVAGKKDYEGAGILSIPLQKLLEDYLENVMSVDLGPFGANMPTDLVQLADYLEGYSSRLKAKAKTQKTIQEELSM